MKNDSLVEKLDRAVQFLRAVPVSQVRMAVVLGSGYGAVASGLEGAVCVPMSEIPGYPVSSVPGHGGELVFGNIGSRGVCFLTGRKHLYEGEGIEAAIYGILLLARLGAGSVILVNSAGCGRLEWSIGDIMLIRDHLDTTFHAFTSEIPDLLGKAGFDPPGKISSPYSSRLNRIALEAAVKMGQELREGIYAFCPGPFFESRAEVAALRNLGADAFGMSTVPEAIAGSLCGMEILGLSGLTNYATGLAGAPHQHGEVLGNAEKIQPKLKALIGKVLQELHS